MAPAYSILNAYRRKLWSASLTLSFPKTTKSFMTINVKNPSYFWPSLSPLLKIVSLLRKNGHRSWLVIGSIESFSQRFWRAGREPRTVLRLGPGLNFSIRFPGIGFFPYRSNCKNIGFKRMEKFVGPFPGRFAARFASGLIPVCFHIRQAT